MLETWIREKHEPQSIVNVFFGGGMGSKRVPLKKKKTSKKYIEFYHENFSGM